jgi:hypothetical protein
VSDEDVPLCEWCEDPADDPHGGFYFEPDEETHSEAEAGFYCSVSCWLSAG